MGVEYFLLLTTFLYLSPPNFRREKETGRDGLKREKSGGKNEEVESHLMRGGKVLPNEREIESDLTEVLCCSLWWLHTRWDEKEKERNLTFTLPLFPMRNEGRKERWGRKWWKYSLSRVTTWDWGWNDAVSVCDHGNDEGEWGRENIRIEQHDSHWRNL